MGCNWYLGAALGEAIAMVILIFFLFIRFVVAAWFLTGSPSHPQARAGHHKSSGPKRFPRLGVRSHCRGNRDDFCNWDFFQHVRFIEINDTKKNRLAIYRRAV